MLPACCYSSSCKFDVFPLGADEYARFRREKMTQIRADALPEVTRE
jgi:hypothetical protein